MHVFLLENPQIILDQKALKKEGIPTWCFSAFEREWRHSLETLRKEYGYIEMDEVRLDAQTPDLDSTLTLFFREHSHTDEEIRFITHGIGIFDIRDSQDRWMRLFLTPGDLIIIPANRFHRFTLDTQRFVVAKRLFKNKNGWEAISRFPAQQSPQAL